MQTIDYRRFKHKVPRRQLPLTRIGQILGIIVLVLLVCNLAMSFAYRDKALPGYRLGAKNVGGMSYGDISKLHASQVMIAMVNLQLKANKATAQKTVPVSDFGVVPDMQASINHLKKS